MRQLSGLAIRLALLSLTPAAIACGSGSAPMMAPPDMGDPNLLPPRPATDHPPLWTMMAGPNKSIQPAPEVYTVVWPGDEAMGDRVEAFVSWMLASDYWTMTLAEYGVGAGKSMGKLVLPTAATATMTQADLEGDIAQLFSSGTIPAPTENTHLMFLLPLGTKLMDTSGQSSCSYFAGFHDITSAAPKVVYSVIAQCSPASNGSVFEDVTQTASHELAEAATDATPGNGYYDTSPAGQEIGDLCNYVQGITIDAPGDATHPAERYWLQRLYSSQAAALGNLDPCLPMAWTHPFFNVAIDPSAITYKKGQTSNQFSAKLEPFAYGDVGLIRWQVFSDDPGIKIEPNAGQSHAGDTIRLTYTISSKAATGGHEIDVQSESAQGGSNWWFSYVTLN
jgi:hypothetical protein